MGIIDILLTGVGLSMDAAAVSMTNGMNEPKMKLPKILLIALFYGGAFARAALRRVSGVDAAHRVLYHRFRFFFRNVSQHV